MNTNQMLSIAVLYYRKHGFQNRFKYLPAVRLKNVYVTLDLQLARLANQWGWFLNHSPKISDQTRQQLMNSYLDGMGLYFLIANLKNWNQTVLVSKSEVNKLTHLKVTKVISQLYLIIKKMLYNSYFNRNLNDFTYSWKLYLKLGLVDLHFSWPEIEKGFRQTFES